MDKIPLFIRRFGIVAGLSLFIIYLMTQVILEREIEVFWTDTIRPFLASDVPITLNVSVSWALVLTISIFVVLLITWAVHTIKTNRDKDVAGILLGERLINSLHAIDLQFMYINGQTALKDVKNTALKAETKGSVDRALMFIVSEIADLIQVEKREIAIILFRIMEDDVIRVETAYNLPVSRIAVIETYHSKNKTTGVVNATRDLNQTIYIPSLDNDESQYIKYWTPFTKDEEKQGGVLYCAVL